MFIAHCESNDQFRGLVQKSEKRTNRNINNKNNENEELYDFLKKDSCWKLCREWYRKTFNQDPPVDREAGRTREREEEHE